MGLYSMAWGIAFAIGPWLGTFTLERFGHVTLWAGAFVVAALASIAMGRMRPPRPS
jgi:MFS family permease